MMTCDCQENCKYKRDAQAAMDMLRHVIGRYQELGAILDMHKEELKKAKQKIKQLQGELP